MAERTEDLNLPVSVVKRIIESALPEGVKVSREARVAIARAASVFVLYATATANNYAVRGKRRTLGAMDVVEAMKDMDFESFVEPLKAALAAYRQQQPPKMTKRALKAQQQQQVEQALMPPAPKRSAYEDIEEDTDQPGAGDEEYVGEEYDDEEAAGQESYGDSEDDGFQFQCPNEQDDNGHEDNE